MTEEDLLLKLRTAIKWVPLASDNDPHHLAVDPFLTLSREPHAAIHRMNLSRIALCVPPQVDRPTLYALGLSRYAEIFYGLEEEWVGLIGDPADWVDRGDDDRFTDLDHADSGERIRSMLRLLYIPELLRSRSLRADLSFLESIDPTVGELLHDRNPGIEVKNYVQHRVRTKPHLLVAWIWILYSAILYGGREIRAQLLKSGSEFWDLSATEIKASRTPCPLSFWHIEDDVAVKTKFRTLIARVDRLLTREEHQEILEESLHIFQKLELLTLTLDDEAAQIQT